MNLLAKNLCLMVCSFSVIVFSGNVVEAHASSFTKAGFSQGSQHAFIRTAKAAKCLSDALPVQQYTVHSARTYWTYARALYAANVQAERIERAVASDTRIVHLDDGFYAVIPTARVLIGQPYYDSGGWRYTLRVIISFRLVRVV